MITAVHLFFYLEEETAARISKWNSLSFTFSGRKRLEGWSTFYFYLRNFQFTLPTDMHTPATLYLRILTIIDGKPSWKHPLQVLKLLGRYPNKICKLSRSYISKGIRSCVNQLWPLNLPNNPPSTPTARFETSMTNAHTSGSPFSQY